MNIIEAHYDFKDKANAVGGAKWRNFTVGEIDWLLNNAYLEIVKLISNPRHRSLYMDYGFELTQRNIDDIRHLVKDDVQLAVNKTSNKTFIADLPQDYMFHISNTVKAKKGACTRDMRAIIYRHDNINNFSHLNKPSFEWDEVGMWFFDGGIKLFTDGTFDVEEFRIDYIAKPEKVHAAKLAKNGSYKLPDGKVLTGKSDFLCQDHLVPEIVNLAVLMASINIGSSDIKADMIRNKLS